MLLHQLFEDDKKPQALPSFKLLPARHGPDGGRVGETFPITYAELNSVFGKASNIKGDKVSTEWVILFSNGVHCSIYDYKETSIYSKSLPSPEKFRKSGPHEWSIGGSMKSIMSKNTDGVTLIYATIFKKWDHEKVIKLILNMYKHPDQIATFTGDHERTIKRMINAARMAHPNDTELDAVEKSIGSKTE